MQWLEQQGAVEEIITLYKDILNYYWKKNTAVDVVEEDGGAKKILKDCIVAQFQQSLTSCAWTVVKQIMQYLKGTTNIKENQVGSISPLL
jgi:hypothetical protein